MKHLVMRQQREGDATEAAKQAVEWGFDLIIAAGGDGTLNEVVAGVSPFEEAS